MTESSDIHGVSCKLAIGGCHVEIERVGDSLSPYAYPQVPRRYFGLPAKGPDRDKAFWAVADYIAGQFGHEDEDFRGTIKDLLEDFFGTEEE